MKKKIIILALAMLPLIALASVFTINSTFNSTPPQNTPCGVTHIAVATYFKALPDWGWKLDMSTSTHTISVPTNAVVEWTSKSLHSGCGIGSVTVTGAATDKFRFSVYWPQADGTPPTNQHPLTLTGFLP